MSEIRRTGMFCENASGPVTFIFHEVARKPYLYEVECTHCGTRWETTGKPEEFQTWLEAKGLGSYRDGKIYAYITCTRVKFEATVAEMAEMQGKTETEVLAEWEGDSDFDENDGTIRLEEAMEDHGWIDRSWSSTVIHDSRNDVRPVVEIWEYDLTDPELREEAVEEVLDALGWLEGGYEDNDNGTFYASENYQPYDDAWSYSYALHFVRKFLGKNGWTEEPWHPSKDGGIELS